MVEVPNENREAKMPYLRYLFMSDAEAHGESSDDTSLDASTIEHLGFGKTVQVKAIFIVK